jgi:hypothetical protein
MRRSKLIRISAHGCDSHELLQRQARGLRCDGAGRDRGFPAAVRSLSLSRYSPSERGSHSSSERVLPLLDAGGEAPVLAFEMERPRLRPVQQRRPPRRDHPAHADPRCKNGATPGCRCPASARSFVLLVSVLRPGSGARGRPGFFVGSSRAGSTWRGGREDRRGPLTGHDDLQGRHPRRVRAYGPREPRVSRRDWQAPRQAAGGGLTDRSGRCRRRRSSRVTPGASRSRSMACEP